MEFYQIYQLILTFYTLKSKDGVLLLKNNSQPFLVAGIVSLVVISALFVLYAIGIYQMSKNRGLKKSWLSFLPFVNLLQVGKLAGDCRVFGRRMKRAGLYAMIVQIISFIFILGYVVCKYYLFVSYGDALTVTAEGALDFSPTSKTGQIVNNVYEISSYLLNILNLIQVVFMFILFSALYKNYSPRNYFIFAWSMVFISSSRFIIPFILRKNKAINYEEYVRRQREQYIRTMYGQNPYGQNPYGNPYNNPYREQPKEKPEDPFGEFSEEEDPFDYKPKEEQKKEEDGWFE